MKRHLFARFRADQKGVSVIEFALIAPTLMMVVMGFFDLSYRAYTTAVLQGEVQKAARDTGLQGSDSGTAALDERVRERVLGLMGNATVTTERKNVASFTRAGMFENFTDLDADNNYDSNECFDDENSNGIWDAVGGRNGAGSSEDIVQYVTTVTYPRLFPMYGLLGWSANQTVTATTILRNQPFGTQDARAINSVCPGT